MTIVVVVSFHRIAIAIVKPYLDSKQRKGRKNALHIHIRYYSRELFTCGCK